MGFGRVQKHTTRGWLGKAENTMGGKVRTTARNTEAIDRIMKECDFEAFTVEIEGGRLAFKEP